MILHIRKTAIQAKPARVFGFDEIVEAHRVMESGQAGGKMTVSVT
jgi:NADPH2:quinone reductase